MTFLLLLALMAPQAYRNDFDKLPWVPAANGQGCGPTAHRHAFLQDGYGRFVVNREAGEPDIVFDGLCHDNDKEFSCNPEITSKGVSTCVDSSRKVIPKP